MSEIEKILPTQKAATVIEVQEQPRNAGEDDEDDAVSEEVATKDYDYLLSMALWSLTEERIAKLEAKLQETERAYSDLEATHIHVLWDRDLERFLDELTKYEAQEEADRMAHKAKGRNGGAGGRRKNKPRPKPKPAKQPGQSSLDFG